MTEIITEWDFPFGALQASLNPLLMLVWPGTTIGTTLSHTL